MEPRAALGKFRRGERCGADVVIDLPAVTLRNLDLNGRIQDMSGSTILRGASRQCQHHGSNQGTQHRRMHPDGTFHTVHARLFLSGLSRNCFLPCDQPRTVRFSALLCGQIIQYRVRKRKRECAS
jgi:hypothetical protein